MEFGETLKKMRLKTGKSRYQIWKFCGLDQAYLGRLEKGDKHPSRETVIMLALALTHNSDKITYEDIEDLLYTAGYASLRRHR